MTTNPGPSCETTELRSVRTLHEMAQPSVAIAAKTFYHGTPREAAGRAILADGIQPGNAGATARGKLTPTAGRSYLTADLRYGVIYAIGGDMLGATPSSAQYLIDKAGRYGYLFVVPGDRLRADIQPDEDSVGEAVMYAARLVKNDTSVARYYSGSALCQNLAQADPWRVQRFVDDARRAMTAKQFSDTLYGLYSAWSSGGKRFLRVMDDATKLWLLDLGAHVAVRGPIIPSDAWRFDKRLVPDLVNDGSNFFTLAERVRR